METFRLKTKNSGFSLIEIILVIVLIAVLAGALVPKVANISRAGTRSSVRRFASLVRYAYDQSVLTGLVHRIVVDFDKNQWSLENATPGILPIEKVKKEYAFNEDDEKTLLQEKEEVESAFKKIDLNKGSQIPGGVKILEFVSWRTGAETIITQGQVSIYAFPNGFIDEASIVLAEVGKENLQRYRLTIKSLTGKVDVEVINLEK